MRQRVHACVLHNGIARTVGNDVVSDSLHHGRWRLLNGEQLLGQYSGVLGGFF